MATNEEVNKQDAEKPPTQGVGVSGFKADVYAADEGKINWSLLMTLPKFQMYCVELSRRNHGEVELWIGGFVKDKLSAHSLMNTAHGMTPKGIGNKKITTVIYY